MILLFQCAQLVPVDTSPFQVSGSFELIHTNCEFALKKTPIIVKKVTDNLIFDNKHSDYYFISVNNGIHYGENNFYIKKGFGSALIPVYGGNSFQIYNSNHVLVFQKTLTFDKYDTLYLSNDILDSLKYIIKENTIVFIYQDIIVPEDRIFTIEKNTVIFLSYLKNIISEGTIICRGTKDEPIQFAPFVRESPWGGIIVKNTAEFEYTILTGGGGNTSGSYVIGHSNSQALIHADNSSAEISNCYFVYNFGKGVTGVQAEISIDSSMFTFCDMGCEFQGSKIHITNSQFLFIPDNTDDYIDDDNDALYFSGINGTVLDSNFSIIDGCIFYHGKDDAIDHNGAFLQIKNSWIENYTHEGLAGSNEHCVTIVNSYFNNCEQGIEAGYGSPHVYANHCLLIQNDVGVRFGDSYDWGCKGHISVINSIIFSNKLDVRNFDIMTNGPVDSAIELHFSLIDSAFLELGNNNIPGEPIFSSNHLLDEKSPGKYLANDLNDIGLLSEL